MPWGIYADPGNDDPELHRVAGRILTGRVRNPLIDSANAYRFPRRRLVKEIRITNLLPWVRAQFPEVPVIYLLRHPIAASWSATQLGWKPFLSEFLRQDQLMGGPLAPYRETISRHSADPDLFQQHVLRWCMENMVPVTQLPGAGVHVIFYEDLVADPSRELGRLAGYLQSFAAPAWAFDPAVRPTVDRPSITNWLQTPVLSATERMGLWTQAVPRPSAERAVALLSAFGLDRVYDVSPRPCIPAENVLQGKPRAAACRRPA